MGGAPADQGRLRSRFTGRTDSERGDAEYRYYRFGSSRSSSGSWPHQRRIPRTLYSDRTADQWLNESRPTGTAARFHISLEYERELGLNYWERDAPKGEGVHLTFSPAKDNRLLTLAGRLKDYFIAVDCDCRAIAG